MRFNPINLQSSTTTDILTTGINTHSSKVFSTASIILFGANFDQILSEHVQQVVGVF
jgi:hypothetical protein